MLPRNLRYIVTLIAGAATLLAIVLAPRWAAAAMLPTCESHELSRMPIEWLAALKPAPSSCSIGEIAVGDDLGDARVAAMCDERGASMVAPPLVHPVADARIDAARGCLPELSMPRVGPGSEEAPVGPPVFAVADQANLGAAELIFPAPSELGPPFVRVAGAARSGVERDIDHPPRCASR